jgi:hypothetical protein
MTWHTYLGNNDLLVPPNAMVEILERPVEQNQRQTEPAMLPFERYPA